MPRIRVTAIPKKSIDSDALLAVLVDMALDKRRKSRGVTSTDQPAAASSSLRKEGSRAN